MDRSTRYFFRFDDGLGIFVNFQVFVRGIFFFKSWPPCQRTCRVPLPHPQDGSPLPINRPPPCLCSTSSLYCAKRAEQRGATQNIALSSQIRSHKTHEDSMFYLSVWVQFGPKSGKNTQSYFSFFFLSFSLSCCI